MKVLKKDGKVQEFNLGKIQRAVEAAGSPEGHAIAVTVAYILEGNDVVTVDEVHDAAEDALRVFDETAADSYHTYRVDRQIQRESESELLKGFLGIVEQSDEETLSENANKASEEIPTMRDLIAGNMTKQYMLKHVLPKHIASAHNEGRIHYHDLDYVGLPITNCALVDAEQMLQSGFTMGAARIETPRSVTTAAAITAQVTAQVACNHYGGTTIPDIDLLWAPYVTASCKKHLATAEEYGLSDLEQVRYAENQTIKEIESACQAYEYECNTLQTSNGQSPFVTITFGRGDSWAARQIQIAYLKQRLLGLGKDGVTPVFPKICFIRKKGLNDKPGTPNYDIKQLAVKCSSKRMYPDFLDTEKLKEVCGSELVVPMGCRAFLPVFEGDYSHNGRTASGEHPYYGRNNLGCVTVNLPFIALDSGGDKATFWLKLEETLGIAKEALDIRVNACKKIQAKVAPILYLEGAFGRKAESPEEYVFDRFFANGRASISLGYIGLYEVSKVMFGKGHHESIEAHDFCEEVLSYMKERTKNWKAEEGIGFSLYGTPSEGYCGKAHDACLRKFGVVEGVTDKGYVQNGFNIDVRASIDPFLKIDMERVFPYYASAGFISYGELSNLQKNLAGLEGIIDYALDRVPYYAINTPADTCFECKCEDEFQPSEEGYICPKCDNQDLYRMSVVRRISGYLSAANQRSMPKGKYAETLVRKKNI